MAPKLSNFRNFHDPHKVSLRGWYPWQRHGKVRSIIQSGECGLCPCNSFDISDVGTLTAACDTLLAKQKQDTNRYRPSLFPFPHNCADSSHNVATDVCDACSDPTNKHNTLDGWRVDNIISVTTVHRNGQQYTVTCENATLLTSPDGQRFYGIDLYGNAGQGFFGMDRIQVGNEVRYKPRVKLDVSCISVENFSGPIHDEDPVFKLAYRDDLPSDTPPFPPLPSRVHGTVNCQAMRCDTSSWYCVKILRFVE